MELFKYYLPRKNSEIDFWIEAVEWGVQGNYAAAAVRLACIYRDIRQAPALRSLAFSTYASHLRQQGWHARAFIYDSYALQHVIVISSSSETENITDQLCHKIDLRKDVSGSYSQMALLDALTGAAADSLGMARFSTAQKYLERAESLLPSQQEKIERSVDYIFSQHRMILRWLWVKTEFLLYTDDIRQQEWAQRTMNHLCMGVNIPPRYRLKTWLIAHAAQVDIADFTISGVSDELLEHKLLPLLWALYLMNDRLADAAQIHSQFHCENWL